MTIFRPLPPASQRSDRSARDRARHKHKIKQSIRDNISDIIAEESIIGQSKDTIIKVPMRSVKEYRFVYGDNNAGVSQGNGEQKRGDVVQQGEEGKGGKPGDGKAGNEAGTDAIETDVTLEELLAIMFEDLELPDLEKRQLKRIVTEHTLKKKGHRKQGIPARLDKRATARQRVRRIKASERGNKEPPPVDGEEERHPFHGDDMRYFHHAPKSKEASNAVIFCIMDTSGSMGTVKKYLARSFYFLLYQFVRMRYDEVEVVFLAHHTEAKEVTEHEFFHKVESGGTYISSGYNLALELIQTRYHPSLWNIYAFHCSDGDNFYSDNDKAVETAKELCKVCNLFGYGEIKPAGGSYYSGTMLEVFAQIEEANFHPVSITSKEDLWPAFRAFLKRDKSQTFEGNPPPGGASSEGASSATP